MGISRSSSKRIPALTRNRSCLHARTYVSSFSPPFNVGSPPTPPTREPLVSLMEEPVELSILLRLLLCSISSVPALYYLLASLLLLSLFLYRFLEFHLLRDILRGSRGDKVHLTFNPASEIYHCVAAKCRILHGRYLATPWLASPHLQTTFVNFFGNAPSFRYTREIFYTIDGGTIALDWLLPSDVLECTSDRKGGISKEDTTPIVVVVPGLTSDSASPYMKHLVFKLAKSGWNVVVGNHRGLGGISMTSDCFYNAGWTEDVRAIIKHLHQEFPVAPIYAVGTSIGANILVKYLGEDGETTPIAGAASVCSPWDLVIGDRFISRKLVQRLYDRAIAFGLKGFAEMHQPLLSRIANWEGIKRSRSIRDFDNHATCLVANYETVDTYYRRCSSVSFVGNVSVPLLCISALDDPLCTIEAIPWDECRANKNIVLATTTHGGHLAFFQGFSAKMLWWVEAVDEFLSVLHGSPYIHKPKKASDTGPHTVLESNIDKAPYLNVLDDGMLAAVGNEEVANNVECTTDNQVSSDEKGIHADPAVDAQETGSGKEAPYLASKALSESTLADIPMKKIAEMVAPVKNSFNQLLRLNSGSMWLLAYIAIVTTWPLVGPALLIALRRKMKRIIPPGWLRK